jgi:hypothetical protein
MSSFCDWENTNMERCSICNYEAKPKDNSQRVWLMKRHYLGDQHRYNAIKKGGNSIFDLPDEGYLEYFKDRVAYVEDMNVRETYLGFMRDLNDRIQKKREEKLKLDIEAKEKGYTNV